MRKYLLASAAAIVALTMPGSAADVTINGNIALKCTLSITHSTLGLGDIATDDSGKHPGGQTNNSTFLDGTAMCNGSKNHVVISATPLTSSTPLPSDGSFTNSINYILTVGNLLPGGLVLYTGNVGGGIDHSDATVAAFSTDSPAGASLITEQPSKPVIAGDYHATVTVSITAAN